VASAILRVSRFAGTRAPLACAEPRGMLCLPAAASYAYLFALRMIGRRRAQWHAGRKPAAQRFASSSAAGCCTAHQRRRVLRFTITCLHSAQIASAAGAGLDESRELSFLHFAPRININNGVIVAASGVGRESSSRNKAISNKNRVARERSGIVCRVSDVVWTRLRLSTFYIMRRCASRSSASWRSSAASISISISWR